MFSLAKLDLSFSSRWPEVFESSKGARDIRGQRESEPKKTGQLLLSFDVLFESLWRLFIQKHFSFSHEWNREQRTISTCDTAAFQIICQRLTSSHFWQKEEELALAS